MTDIVLHPEIYLYYLYALLLKMVLCLFRYRMRLYVNHITTSNDNSWMMLIWAAEILQSHSDKIKSFCSFLIFQTKAIERKTCRIEMLYIASKLSILMVSHNHDIYCQIGLLYKKKMKRKLFDIYIKEFITIKIFIYILLFIIRVGGSAT